MLNCYFPLKHVHVYYIVDPLSFLHFQEIDHIGYVRQAFEDGSLQYCLDILQCDILKEYDVRHCYLCGITCYSG